MRSSAFSAHAALGALALCACVRETGVPPASVPAAAAGSVAPDFTLRDLEDRPVALSSFRGKVVLLTFWGVG